MNNLTFNANLNLKTVPYELIIHGSIMTYRTDDEIIVEMADPQGINPSILLINIIVKQGKGPMKGTAKPFSLILNNESVKNYTKVTMLLEDGESQTEDVKIFG
jgi:hypothetical protein